MTILWNGFKYVFTIGLILALVFTSSVFGVLLVAKMTRQEWITGNYYHAEAAAMPASPAALEPPPEPVREPEPVKPVKKASVLLDAPVIRQHPELPAGCEITSLAMLLQFAGIDKSKMDLVPEMPKDPTEIRWAAGGGIESWGDPNVGFVGDVTGKSKAFGIYHKGLFPLLQKYVPSGIDLTGQSFERLEEQLSEGFPVIAWTTINFGIPSKWVTWNTASGPIKTTFLEHAVLLVGYDDKYVYANDPWTGAKNVKIDKAKFISTWEIMGKQALSYDEV